MGYDAVLCHRKLPTFGMETVFFLQKSRQFLTCFNTTSVQFEISSEDFIRKVPKVFQLKEIKIIYGVQTDELLSYTKNGVFSLAKNQ